MSEPFPEEVLAPLRQRFLVRAKAALDLIEAYGAGADPAMARPIQEAAHKLAGIAATLGFAAIGAAAARVELRDMSPAPDAVALAELKELETALAAATGPRS